MQRGQRPKIAGVETKRTPLETKLPPPLIKEIVSYAPAQFRAVSKSTPVANIANPIFWQTCPSSRRPEYDRDTKRLACWINPFIEPPRQKPHGTPCCPPAEIATPDELVQLAQLGKRRGVTYVTGKTQTGDYLYDLDEIVAAWYDRQLEAVQIRFKHNDLAYLTTLSEVAYVLNPITGILEADLTGYYVWGWNGPFQPSNIYLMEQFWARLFWMMAQPKHLISDQDVIDTASDPLSEITQNVGAAAIGNNRPSDFKLSGYKGVVRDLERFAMKTKRPMAAQYFQQLAANA